MVVRRAVRIARALALVSSGACSSGASATSSTDETPVQLDAAAETSAPRDASADRGETRVDGPSCFDVDEEIGCDPGKVCEVDMRYGLIQCVAPDAGVLKPCGVISCGWLCACSDAATSTCQCYTDAGPLPPPDLPAEMTEWTVDRACASTDRVAIAICAR